MVPTVVSKHGEELGQRFDVEIPLRQQNRAPPSGPWCTRILEIDGPTVELLLVDIAIFLLSILGAGSLR